MDICLGRHSFQFVFINTNILTQVSFPALDILVLDIHDVFIFLYFAQCLSDVLLFRVGLNSVSFLSILCRATWPAHCHINFAMYIMMSSSSVFSLIHSIIFFWTFIKCIVLPKVHVSITILHTQILNVEENSPIISSRYLRLSFFPSMIFYIDGVGCLRLQLQL